MSEKKAAPIPGFQLLKKLGQGGMGAVYRAVQESMNREVALKVVSIGNAKDPVFLERFFREAKAAGRLNHPNIVQGIDAGQTDRYCWIAMELVEGGSVAEALDRQGAYTEADALRLVTDIARGLVHAHANGIIHRDIKPENFLIDDKGAAKLCDLGIAKAPTDPGLTQEGRALGTPRYIAPEQAQGLDTVDGRADIYSLGISWYHMLTGAPPFDGPTAAAIMMKHIRESVPPLAGKVPGISPQTVLVMEKMIGKEPEKRYHNATELLEDLESLAAGRPPKHIARSMVKPTGARSSPARTPHPGSYAAVRKGNSPVLLGALAGGAVLLVILIALLAGGEDRREAPVQPAPAQVQQPRPLPPTPAIAKRPTPTARPEPRTTSSPGLKLPAMDPLPPSVSPSSAATGKAPSAQAEQAAAKRFAAMQQEFSSMEDWRKSIGLEELIGAYPGTKAAISARKVLDEIQSKMTATAIVSAGAAATKEFESLRTPSFLRTRRTTKSDRPRIREQLLQEYTSFVERYPGTDEATTVQSWIDRIKNWSPKQLDQNEDESASDDDEDENMEAIVISSEQPLPGLMRILQERARVPRSSIAPFLTHAEPKVRQVALQCLYGRNPSKAAPDAMNMLRDTEPMNRLLAIGILQQLNASEAITAIEELSRNDPDPQVQKAAQAARSRMY